jgi:hypothetical protein
MENLVNVLKDKKLEDLQTVKEVTKSNLIEPTAAEVELILTALVEGKEYKEIKKTIRRVAEGSAKGFSYAQIKEIDLARQAKIAELTPVEEAEVEKL